MAAGIDGVSKDYTMSSLMPRLLMNEVSTETVRYGQEIKDKQRTIKLLQEDINKEKRSQSDLQLEICKLNKKVCITQDETSDTKRITSKCLQSIEEFISQNKSLEISLQEQNKSYSHHKDMFNCYSERMKAYKHKVSLNEDKLPLNIKLQETQHKLKELKDKRSSYITDESLEVMSGQRHKETESRIECLVKEEQETKQDISSLKDKSLTLKDKIKKLSSELDISRKRKQAHLIRLRHQLHEAQSRKRQWTMETERLKISIKLLKRKIEE